MPTESKLEIKIAAASLVISIVAIVIAWVTSSQDRSLTLDISELEQYQNYVDIRIEHCTALSQVYADQSWAYRSDRAPDNPAGSEAEISEHDGQSGGSESDADTEPALGSSTETPDPDLERYSQAAIAVARAARLCRNEHWDVEELRACIARDVDRSRSHIVIDTGDDNEQYPNLIC